MSVQRTFRDVAKPSVKALSATLVGGVLALDEATKFVFSADAVGTISSLSGHEYLVDGQAVYFINAHPSNNLVISIGAFNHTIPAGYGDILFFDEANTSFTRFDKSEAKQIRDDIALNASNLATEISDRQADTALNYRLDGSRALTGNMDANNNMIQNVQDGASAGDAINKGQLDTEVATLQAAISANATALKWRDPIEVITEFTTGNIPVNGDALVDSTFGAGNSRLFEDDDAPSQFTTASFPVDVKVLFLKSGEEPKLMVARDNLGTKRWYDETEVDAGLKLDRQAEAGDTFITKNDLLDSSDAHEQTAIYHVEEGTPKTAIKIGDLDWDQATGIDISTGYSKGAGGETVVPGDSVEGALQKLDGNIDANDAAQSAALSAAIAQEVIDRDAAIAAESAILSAEIDSDILASQSAQDANLASTSAGQGASLIGIEDSAAIITATTVEGALAENRTQIDANEADITSLQSDVSLNTTNIATNASDIAQNAADLSQLESDLASNANGLGASKIGIEDSNGDFTATTVEGALAELDAKVDGLNLVVHRRGLHEAASTGATTLDLTTDFLDTLSGGGVVQDLSSATYSNVWIVRDGAVLLGETGFTISGSTLTFTSAGGGELLAGEVVEVRVVDIS